MASNIDTTLPIHGSAFDDVRAQLQIAKDEITALQGGGGGSTYNVECIQFTFATPSPMVLHALVVGHQVDRAHVVITTTFDDHAANIQLGTVAVPGLFIDIPPTMAGQFADDNILDVTVPDFLRFTISPGTSTQGDGFIFYSVRG